MGFDHMAKGPSEERPLPFLVYKRSLVGWPSWLPTKSHDRRSAAGKVTLNVVPESFLLATDISA
jgi:hypothetical protein